jgi:2-polyprenyl-3-methyl-5-hydroxy-6-metoxy-1,4-benzoquinol methylase
MLTSTDLADLEKCWEKPLVDAHLAEALAKNANAKDVLQRIEALIPKGKLLDFGCFCGQFLAVAASRSWDVWGLEPLIGPAIYARGQFGLRVLTDTLHEDTFPAGFFDVVTAFQVLEHLRDPAVYLNRIRTIMKPAGLVVTEVPNIAALAAHILGPYHRHFVQDHLWFFSEHTLSRLLRSCGFEPVYAYYPTRVLSLQMVSQWLGKLYSGAGPRRTPGPKASAFATVLVKVNLGDIVCVVARKCRT